MDRRNGTGPDDRRPEDYDPGSSAGRGNPGDKIGKRPDRGGVARRFGMGKGATEMSGEMIEAEIERLAKDRDEWRAEATRLTNAGTGLIVMLNTSKADVERLTTERDTAISGQHKLRLELERIRAECEGLRADLLAHPPQRIDFQQYVALKADHEQQVTIIEALQEALRRTEAMLGESQDKGATLMRGAESDHQIILGLREALERSDKRLSQAKARQIPPALVGLLGVIRREAAAAEKMIL